MKNEKKSKTERLIKEKCAHREKRKIYYFQGYEGQGENSVRISSCDLLVFIIGKHMA
jgi:hypothetical protein